MTRMGFGHYYRYPHDYEGAGQRSGLPAGGTHRQGIYALPNAAFEARLKEYRTMVLETSRPQALPRASKLASKRNPTN